MLIHSGLLPWLSKELMGEKKTKGKKKLYEIWKKDMATWEEYRNAVRTCRDAVRKAKAHLELNLVREVKDNKKSCGCWFFVFFFSSMSVAKGRLGKTWACCIPCIRRC